MKSKIIQIIKEVVEDYLNKDNLIQAVIFDFDLTLVDTHSYEPYHHYARTHRDWSIYDKHVQETSVYQGIKELVSYLHDNNIRVIVVTDNKQSVAANTLTYHGVQYDAIAGAQGYASKASRMLRLLGKFSINPSNAISIGDMPSDKVQSDKAQIKFIGCSWGNNMINGINNPLDIIKIIERYNKKDE